MESFTEAHAKLMLGQEWLVKPDGATSTPYLMKCYFSRADLQSVILITDTKSVWGEVLSGKELARRWRLLNPGQSPLESVSSSDEDDWRTNIMDLLSKAYSLGGIGNLTFEVVPSSFADLAFDMEPPNGTWRWRWDTCFVGYKLSAEILSVHLIAPLISANYLAFSSSEPVGDISDSDLEKAIDKVGKTARRTFGIHVRNAISSKPRVATTLRRLTALFNFATDLPSVTSSVETPELQTPAVSVPPPPKHRESSPMAVDRQSSPLASPVRSPRPPASTSNSAPKAVDPAADSATESESDEDVPAKASDASVAPAATTVLAEELASQPRSTTRTLSDSASPPPAKKKTKAVAPSSSDDDSDKETAPKRPAAGAKRGGARQPIKRGGKRF